MYGLRRAGRYTDIHCKLSVKEQSFNQPTTRGPFTQQAPVCLSRLGVPFLEKILGRKKKQKKVCETGSPKSRARMVVCDTRRACDSETPRRACDSELQIVLQVVARANHQLASQFGPSRCVPARFASSPDVGSYRFLPKKPNCSSQIRARLCFFRSAI